MNFEALVFMADVFLMMVSFGSVVMAPQRNPAARRDGPSNQLARWRYPLGQARDPRRPGAALAAGRDQPRPRVGQGQGLAALGRLPLGQRDAGATIVEGRARSFSAAPPPLPASFSSPIRRRSLSASASSAYRSRR